MDSGWQFEWDENKANANLQKHKVSFLTAAAIFNHQMLERVDDREDYGEVRWIAIGRDGLDIYRVTFTLRGPSVIRIINAQRANSDETRAYYREIFHE